MVYPYLWAVVGVGVVSLVSLSGLFFLSLREDILRKYLFLFMSVAVGALLGDVFIHLIPEVFEETKRPTFMSVLLITGIILFFVLEKFLHWHHHGDDAESAVHPVGKLIIVSDGVHNFIDGAIIAASFLVSFPIGVATTLAVILHEIPQEVGDFSVLLHAGYSKMRALWLNFVSALSAFLGIVFFFLLEGWATMSITLLLPLAAGGFIYIALADLIPELHKTKNPFTAFLQLLAIIGGVMIMVALTWVE